MARTKKNKKIEHESKQYNAENEIIIGVTTKSNKKEKQRVDNKTTRSKSNTKVTPEHKKRNKKIKKKEINSRAKKGVVSAFVIVTIILAGSIYYLTTPTFNIININIKGNKKLTEEECINLIGINLNETNIYAITKNQIAKRLKQNTYVDSVEIKRKLPNTLEINIKERRTSFQVKYNKEYIYIDSQGYILEFNEKKLKVPILIGLESFNEQVTSRERLVENDLYKINTIFKIVNYLENNSIQNEITSINAIDISNYILNMDKDKKIIYLGDASNISERMDLLKSILDREKGKKGKIFMDGDPNKDDVYFREEK